MTNRNWLKSIEAILAAKTHDLKELARIADLDPTTMFIGTRMDGADIQGQDLRGVIFTHLDKTKVRWNAATQLDGDPAPPEPMAEGPRALILFVNEQLEAAFRDDMLPWRVKLYGRRDRAAFIKDGQEFPGPRLVLGAFTTLELRHSAQLLGSFDPRTLHVIGRYGRQGPLNTEDRAMLIRLDAPVMFVPLGNDPGGYRRDLSFDATLRDVLRLVIETWPLVHETVQDLRVCSFLRGRPVRGGDRDSAWFGLYTRARNNAVARNPGLRFSTIETREEPLAFDSGAILFPQTRAHWIERRSPELGFDAALLLALEEHSSVQQGPEYEDVVSSVLRQRGWRIEGKSGGKHPQLVQGEASEFPIRWGSDGRRQDPPRVPTHPAEVRFDHLEDVHISEHADPKLIVTMIAARRALWVNVQDLRLFFADRGTLWGLIALQAHRMAQVATRQDHDLYFGGLVVTALGQRHEGDPDVHAIRRELEGGEYHRWRRLETSVQKAPAGVFLCDIDLFEEPNRVGPPIMRFTLSIDDRGPSLSPSPRPWRPRRGGPGSARLSVAMSA